MNVEADIARAVAGAIPGLRSEAVRLPARGADCGVYAPDAALPPPAAFGQLLGVPLVRAVRAQSGWLLLSFTDAFFDACVSHVCETLPMPAHDGGDLALNRMLLLARQGGTGCPDLPQSRRALLLLLSAHGGRASAAEAGKAFCRMLDGLSAGERQRARLECGALSGAAARLYASCGGARPCGSI